jgi:hypothetical protein
MPATIRFEPILPTIPRLGVLKNFIRQALMEEGEIVRKELGKFFMTWEGKPDIIVTVEETGKALTATIQLRGDPGLLDVIGYVIYGTEPHIITPKEPGYPMVFPSGDTFTPKTQPGVIQSQPGFPGGPEIVRTYLVHHPGNAPRRTFEVIAAQRRKFFRARMAKAVGKGILAAIKQGIKP